MGNEATIIGRVGSSVLLFQVEPAVAMPPYKSQGEVYSLSNLLCFCQHAPRAIMGVATTDQKKKLLDLVKQANLVQKLEDCDFLLPSIFTPVDNEFFTTIGMLVGVLRDPNNGFDPKPNEYGSEFEIGDYKIGYHTKDQHAYLKIGKNEYEPFRHRMKTVERYLQL